MLSSRGVILLRALGSAALTHNSEFPADMLQGGTSPAAKSPARILVAEREALMRVIIQRKMSELGHLCETCEGWQDALRRLEAAEFDLLVADILPQEELGSILLGESLRLRPDLAVILMAAQADLAAAVSSLKEGAYDYVTKPVSLDDICLSVARALERRRLLLENRRYRQTLEQSIESRTLELKEAVETLRQTYHSTLLALGTALDSRDHDGDGHSLRSTMYALRLARFLGLGEAEMRSLEQAGFLHDIGKIGLPDRLLRKPGPLNSQEWALMRKHPEIGYRILSGIKFLREASVIILQHHENYDGTGYPAGLRGEEITLGARIFAVADTLDCLTTDRPFQTAVSMEEARERISHAGSTRLDPWIVDAFLELPAEEWSAIRAAVAGKGRRIGLQISSGAGF